MHISEEKCTNCAKCLPVCPVGAIYVEKSRKKMTIDFEKCVECGVCYRANVCASGAITPQKLAWPRSIRAGLSDPLIVNPETRIPGRGTEEMKTNDITGRFRRGCVGIAIELGRPGTSTSFLDIQKVARACAQHQVVFCAQNPVTFLMVNKETGDINPDVLGERVLSGIIEFETEIGKAPAIISSLKKVADELDTVFSLDICNLVEPDGGIPMYAMLEKAGIHPSPNGKNNMGLGRPAYHFFED